MANEQETVWDCPKCPKGKLVKRFSRKTETIFLGCNQYPKCTYTQPLEKEDMDND